MILLFKLFDLTTFGTLPVAVLELDSFLKYNFNVKDSGIKIEWMLGAQTNIAYNALGS